MSSDGSDITAQERYRAFIANSTEGIWRFELEEPVPIDLPEDEQIDRYYRLGYLAEANDAFARMYGFETADELIGARLGDMLVRDDPANDAYLRAFIRAGYRLVEAESVETDREGRILHFANSLTGVVQGRDVVRAWGTQRDITGLKAAQAEIVQLNERLHRAIYESNHRIKNQLQALRATVDLYLIAADGGPLSSSALERLGAHVDTLAAVNDLLTHETRTDGTASRIELKALLERVLGSLKGAAQGGGIAFSVDPVTVTTGVGAALVMVLNEAIANALKHGGESVEVRLRVEGDQGALEVIDSGDGFPEGFDPKTAANTGLELIENLVRFDLRGTVEYGNTPSGGARVAVRFPLEPL